MAPPSRDPGCVCNGSGYCTTCHGEGCERCNQTGGCKPHTAWQLPKQLHFAKRLQRLESSVPERLNQTVRALRVIAPRFSDAVFVGWVRRKHPDLERSRTWSYSNGDGRWWDLPGSRALCDLLDLVVDMDTVRVRLRALWDPALKGGEGAHRWRVSLEAEQSDLPGSPGR
jgi:hypothetical protein